MHTMLLCKILFFTLADERGESGFVMKSELALTTKRVNLHSLTKRKDGSKNRGKYSFIFSQPLCFML